MFVLSVEASATDAPARAEMRRLCVRRGQTRLRAYDMKLADLRIAYIDPRTQSFARDYIPLRNNPDSQNTSHQPRSSVASSEGFYRGNSPS